MLLTTEAPPPVPPSAGAAIGTMATTLARSVAETAKAALSVMTAAAGSALNSHSS